MKNLLACLAILAAFSVAAQTETSNFPYNPDSDGDGLIGVSDLVNLLGYYETQFNVSAQLNSDSTSAIYFPSDWFSIGLSRTQCFSRCDSLPGPWHVMTFNGFGKHLKSIRDSLEVQMIALGHNRIESYFWQFDYEFDHKMPAMSDNHYPVHTIVVDNNDPYGQVVNSSYGTFDSSYEKNEAYERTTDNDEQVTRCLCELRQRPRVEYDFCEGSMANIQPCAAEKVSQGWYPLELTSAGGAVFVQTFWRWED